MTATKSKIHRASNISIQVTGGLLLDYQKHLKSRELAEKHIKCSISHCARIISETKMTYITDITASKIENYIATIRERGIAASTTNCAVAKFKAFCNWMYKQNLIRDNPISKISKLNEKADKRIIRRALTINEIDRLLQATANSEIRYKMSGYERSLVYRLALSTGLRFNEIRTLEVNNFDFSDEIAKVTINAKNEKAGRGDVLPLKPDLVADLQEYFKTKPITIPQNFAFTNLPERGAPMIKKDLQEARIELENDLGRVDFHALRHTYGTLLAKANVHPKKCQELMRHAKMETTMSLYTHVVLSDKAEALSSLPEFGIITNFEQKTGTAEIVNDIISAKQAPSKAQKSAKIPSKSEIQSLNESAKLTHKKTGNPLSLKDYQSDISGAGNEIRTHDPHLGKVVL